MSYIDEKKESEKMTLAKAKRELFIVKKYCKTPLNQIPQEDHFEFQMAVSSLRARLGHVKFTRMCKYARRPKELTQKKTTEKI